jgi:PKD repeat protein
MLNFNAKNYSGHTANASGGKMKIISNLTAGLIAAGIMTGLSGSITATGQSTDSGLETITQSSLSPDLTNGLVAYYPFHGDANDASGNGNNGTVVNASFQTNGPTGIVALEFSGGSSTYVHVPQSPSLEPTNGLSVSIWCFGVPGQACGDGNGTILRKADNCDPGYFIRGCNGQSGYMLNGPNVCVGGPLGVADFLPFTGTNWQHIVGTYSVTDGTIKAYENGLLVSQVPYTNGLTHSGDLYIGGAVVSAYQDDGGFDGLINEVRIYNRELSSNEVAQLYAIGQPQTLNDGLVAYYPFNGNANDASGNGNNGTVVDATFQTNGPNGSVALTFAGSQSSYVLVPDAASLDPTNAISIAMWCNGVPNSPCGGGYGTVLRKALSCQPGYLVRGCNSGPFFELDSTSVCTPGGSGTANFLPFTGTSWQFIAGTYSVSSGVIRTYENGVLLNETAYSKPLANSGTLFIGGANVDSGDSGFLGSINQVRIYNRELSSNEVAQLYALGGSTPPVASFTATPTNGIAPLAVTFTDTSTGAVTNWFWNFGDGHSTNLATSTAAYTYSTGGLYTVTEIVSGPAGVSTNTQLGYISVLDFRITAIAKEGSNIRVTWIGDGGRGYVLQSTKLAAVASFTTNFTDIGPVILASGVGPSTTNYLDVGAAYAPMLIPPAGMMVTTSVVPSTVDCSADGTRGITDSTGRALPTGCLLMLGTFSMSESTIQSNFSAGNVSAIMSNFTLYGASFAVGNGTGLPATWDVSESAAGFGGQRIYLVAIDTPTFAASTHLGIYTAPSWVFPADGNEIDIDLADVTDFVIGAQGGPLTIGLPLGGETYTFNDTARLSVLPGRILFYRVRLAQ